MTFNAGAIEAELKLNRRPFQDELAKAKKDAQAFARGKYTARLGADTAGLNAELDRLRARLDLITRDRTVRIKVKTDEAEKGLGRVAKKTDEAEKSLNHLWTAIVTLGPPLVPLAGGLVAMSTAAVGLGLSGITAFLGIRNEIKANTQVGLEYKGLLTSLKAPLDELSKTSALAVQPGVTEAVSKLKAEVPQLNVFLAQSSTILGDVVSHLTGGLVDGLRTFSPLMLEVEHGVDHVAARFESWATGPGGAHFAQTLTTDYREAVPALKSLGELVVHLVSALNSPGSITMLKVIGGLADVIDAFPIGLLQTMVTTYTAWRITVAVTAGLEAARKALLGLAAAEAVAGAAGGAGGAGAGAGAVGGLRGRLAGGLALAIPYAAAVIGVTFAVKAAAAATKDWVSSTSALKSGIGTTLDAISHPFDIPGVVNRDTAAHRAAQDAQFDRNRLSSLVTQATTGNVPLHGGGVQTPSQLALQNSGYSAQQIQEALTALKLWQQGRGPWAHQTPAQLNANPQLTAASVYQQNLAASQAQLRASLARQAASAAGYRGNELFANSAALYNTNKNINVGGLATAGTQIASLQKQYQSATDSENKFLDSGNKLYIKFGQQHVAAATFNEVLKQQQGIYGNTQKATDSAIGIIQGHIQAQKDDAQATKDMQAAQDRINGALTIAQSKYGLTAQQATVYGQVLGISTAALANGSTSLSEWDTELAINAKRLSEANANTNAWIDSVNTFDTTADSAASHASLMGAAMVALQGPTLAYANVGAQAAAANQQFVTDFNNAKKGVVNLKTGIIDFHNAGAAPLLSDLSSLQTAARAFAEQTYQNEVATKGQAQAAKDASAVFKNDTYSALIGERKQLGLTLPEAQKLAQTYFNWPKDAQTQIEQLGGDNVQSVLKGILEDLDHFTGGHHAELYASVTMDAASYAIMQKFSALVGSHTSGKEVSVSANGNIFTAFASGSENHIAQIGKPGMTRIWNEPETQGEAYIPFAMSKRARSQAIAKETVHRLGGAAYFETGGFSGVTDGSGSGSSGSGGSSSGSKYSTLLSAIETELVKLAGASKYSASSISSLSSTLLTSAKTAQSYGLITSTTLKRITTETTSLTNIATTLETAQNKLKTDTASYYSLVASDRANVIGGFDIGTSGNGYAGGILSTLQGKVADASKFKAEIDQARSLGLGQEFIKQLVKEGPTTAGANLQAIIAEAGKDTGYIGKLNSNYTTLYGLGGQLGAVDAGLTYGPTLDADRKQIAYDRKAELNWLALIHKDLVSVESAVSKRTHS